MKFLADPIGYAIDDYTKNCHEENIKVFSDLCEQDVIPVDYLFRQYEEMPEVEKKALSLAEGKILDIGVGAGCHLKYLKDKGFEVVGIDTSAGACQHLREAKITVHHENFMQFNTGKYDTIYLLMNGIGLCGSLENLNHSLQHLKKLLNPGGKIICDSTDIQYMYTQDDGSIWMDLNAVYYGEMKFNMVYKDVESGWFPWLYVDPLKFTEYAVQNGFDIEIILTGDNNEYLAELKMD